MDSILSVLDEDRFDYLHNEPTYTLYYLIKESDDHTTSITVNKDTNIISFPRKYEIIKSNLKYFEDLPGVDPSLFDYAKMNYIPELNLLMMNDDASHRLASLYLYVQDGFELKIDKENLRYFDHTIDIDKLKKYYFFPNERLLFIEINGQIKHQEFLDESFYDLLVHLQDTLLGTTNILTREDSDKFKIDYENREKSPLEIAQDLLRGRF